jgi:formate-dependent nitrite reductase membrane component NrfD
MWFQCIAIVACLWTLAWVGREPAASNAAAIPNWLNATVILSLWLAVLSTLYSGYQYVLSAIQSIDLGAR